MLQSLFDDYPERKATGHMLRRLSMPNKHRGAAVFLPSNASGFMTTDNLRRDRYHTA